MSAHPGRRLRYGVAASLDGYIAGPKGEADWIPMDPEIDFAAIWSQFDAVLMGRRTFERMGHGGGGGASGISTYVVSRTLDPAAHRGVTLLGGDRLAESVAALKAQPGKDIWLFGGGDLFRSLASLGLVDAIDVAIVPVLLGQGIPLRAAPADMIKMRLASHRVYAKTGTVILHYDLATKTSKSKSTMKA